MNLQSSRRSAAVGLMLFVAGPTFAADDLLYESPQQEFGTPETAGQGNLGTIRFDNVGSFQKNVNGSSQWQYRPRIYVPWVFGNSWITTLRIDAPMISTNNVGPAKTTDGYSEGMSNVFFEQIVDTAPVLPNLTLRTSLRFVLKSPKGPPFGIDNQNLIAPGAGFTYLMPDTLRGVTFSPYLRWLRGFNSDTPGTPLVSTLQVVPTIAFRLDERWWLAFYAESVITYNFNTDKWFAPLDLMLVHRWRQNLEFGFGGATKIGNPSGATFDYVVTGRVSFLF